jgi:hypothetical protein
MRKVLVLTAALSLSAAPAFAGELGAGGCNWSTRQITAEVVVPKDDPVAKLVAALAPISEYWRTLQARADGVEVARMIEDTKLLTH